MRPIKLEMQAFGPYAKNEVIDFTKLGNRTMFVISGKTGSGKTTIFDGISFAIYGRASGDDRVGTDLRSHFAADEMLTEVALEFSLRDQTYYIWRSPQQQRKKTRGDGFTTAGAKAELYMVDENGNRKLLAANVRDTDEKIKEIIQLDANQFRQILMIPQGDFRKLLTSDSKEKETILQRLFNTELYKVIEEKLKEEAGTLKKHVETGVAERSRVLKGLFSHGNEQLKVALTEDVPNDALIMPLLDEIAKEMLGEVERLGELTAHQRHERDAAKKKLDSAEDLLKQMEIREQLAKRKEELELQKDEIEKKKTEVDLAHKANKLGHQENLCHRLKKDLDGYTIRLTGKKQKVTAISQLLESAKKQLEAEEGRSELRESTNNHLVKLKNMRNDVYSFASRKAELDKLEKSLQECRNDIDSEKISLSDFNKTIEDNQTRLKKLEQMRLAAFDLEKMKNDLDSSVKHLNLLDVSASKAKEISNKLVNQKELLMKAENMASDARETLSVIEQKWHQGQAGILAGQLTIGAPCSVCGSLDHPEPAESATDLPTEADLKTAKKDVEILNTEFLNVERAWLKLKTEAEHANEATTEKLAEVLQLIPEFKMDDIAAFQHTFNQELLRIKQNINESNIQVKQIPILEARLLDLTIKRDKKIEQLEQMAEREKELAIKHAESITIISNLIHIIPETLRTKELYDQEIANIEKKKQSMDKALESARNEYTQTSEQLAVLNGALVNLQSHIEKAEEALDAERNIFLKQLEEEGFLSYKAYAESKREKHAIAALEDDIQTYGEDYRSISDRLKDYVERLNDAEKPELAELEKQFIELENKLNAVIDQRATLINNMRHNEGISKVVHEINSEIKSAEEKYELIGHLADITRGQNTYRLTFERFVLASFLDDIINAANARLIKMTSGRYQLLRKTDRSKGNIQSGLELLIFDQYTGQDRHVKTLSGGESFKAALALALGLADVVQEHAGGVSLETMFIDEGFGTLDPESLDQAIEALLDIQSSGRLVGIISHVPDLKERIDARLEVKSYQNGSITEFQFSG